MALSFQIGLPTETDVTGFCRIFFLGFFILNLSACCSQSNNCEGADLLVIEGAMAPLLPVAIIYNSLEKGPIPSVQYSSSKLNINKTVYDNIDKNTGNVAWLDNDNFVVWSNPLHRTTLWNRNGARVNLRQTSVAGFQNEIVWGTTEREVLKRPGVGDPPRNRLAAQDVYSGNTRFIPLTGCDDGTFGPLDGGVSIDGKIAFCLTKDKITFTTVDTQTGVKIASINLPVRNEIVLSRGAAKFNLSSIGLTGDNQPLIGYSNGLIYAYKLSDWANPIKLPGRVFAAEGIPGTSLIVAIYQDSNSKALDKHVAVIKLTTGEHLFDLPTKGVCCNIVASRDGRYFSISGLNILWLFSLDINNISQVAVIGNGESYRLGGAAFDPQGKTLTVIAPVKVALFTINQK